VDLGFEWGQYEYVTNVGSRPPELRSVSASYYLQAGRAAEPVASNLTAAVRQVSPRSTGLCVPCSLAVRPAGSQWGLKARSSKRLAERDAKMRGRSCRVPVRLGSAKC
jgi:hypothetical protein